MAQDQKMMKMPKRTADKVACIAHYNEKYNIITQQMLFCLLVMAVLYCEQCAQTFVSRSVRVQR